MDRAQCGRDCLVSLPNDVHPRAERRPPLIRAVSDDDAPQFTVRVAYRTSQRSTTLSCGELCVERDRNPAAFESATLSFDTKSDLKQALDLPFTPL